jgi:phosphoenolpyruvate-protein kinase (PTS system EI component)
MITDAAHRHGRLVSICGEMASDPALTALLIGLGIDELSCAPAALPRLRSAVRATDAAAARQQARAALSAGSLDEVRTILRTDAPQ